jgi:heptaprenyl diphosphate synthase
MMTNVALKLKWKKGGFAFFPQPAPTRYALTAAGLTAGGIQRFVCPIPWLSVLSDIMKNNLSANKQKSVRLARRVAVFGISAALALALSFFESLIPPLFSLYPGIKLGLSNVVTMTCAATFGAPCAIAVAVIKGAFAGLTRGFVAMLMSLVGGLLSTLAVCLLLRFRLGYLVISVIGAVTHNMAQLVVCAFISANLGVFVYAPVLIVSGIVAGCITGSILCLLTKSKAGSGLKNL